MRAQESRKRNPEQRKEAYLKKKFGITLEEYNQRRGSQQNLCAICKTGRADHLDHNHTTNKIRKFLCFKCNMGIGYLNEDENLFVSAAKYLKENN